MGKVETNWFMGGGGGVTSIHLIFVGKSENLANTSEEIKHPISNVS